MTSLQTIILDVEKYSIKDVVKAAEDSLLPCSCGDDAEVIEIRVAEKVDPIRLVCQRCGKDAPGSRQGPPMV